MIITTIGLIGFVAVLLSPGSGSQRGLHHVALIPIIVAFGGFAVFSLAFMLCFHVRPSTTHEEVYVDRSSEPMAT